MPKFNVSVKEVHNAVYLNIVAKDEKDAVVKAKKMMEAGESEDFFEFDHTLEPDMWTVEKAG
jgi:hypothetical protein